MGLQGVVSLGKADVASGKSRSEDEARDCARNE